MATIPSVAVIPSGYKASKLYSVLPTDGSGDFNFARASEATRVNKDGLIEKVGSNVPRIDYTDGGCPKLLLEPQSTNLITYSEDFTDASWIKAVSGVGLNPVVTSNYALSPDGSVNATRVQFDLGGGATNSDISFLQLNYSATLGLDYTLSVYLKLNSGTADLIVDNNTFNSNIVTLTNEWVRYDLTRTSDATITKQVRIGLRGGNTSNDTADVLIFGAQLEQKSYPTSYIPTNGSTVTRSAETCNGAGDASTFNSSEGVLFAEISALDSNAGQGYISISDGISDGDKYDNRVSFLFSATGIRAIIQGTSHSTRPLDVTYTVSDMAEFHKVAVKYKANDFSFWVDGIKRGSSNSGPTPNNINILEFDLNNHIAGKFYGNVKDLRVYNTALTDTELEELTTI